MGLETGTYISDLDVANPVGATDKRHQGDNHIRLVKSVLKTTFPNATKPFRFPTSATKTGNYTVLSSDDSAVFYCDTSGGAFHMTLPALTSGDAGYEVSVVKSTADTNAVTVVGTINGESNMTLNNRFEVLNLFWTGTVWIGEVVPNGLRVTVITGDLTVTEDHLDGAILSTPSGANKTITLPAAANYRGRTLTVHHTGATFSTTLDGNASETINGATTYVMSITNSFVVIISNGTNWLVIGQSASGAITSSALTMATARLLGRTTAGVGAVEEISVGAGLSLSAGSLSASSGFVLRTQVFSASGTYTPNANLLYCEVISTGGGGGGGSGSASSSTRGCGGGGAGATCIEVFSAATIGASQAVTIGAGGAAESAGGNTTFGAFHTANGGAAGTSIHYGNSATNAGGAGGTATGGDINISGGDGHDGAGIDTSGAFGGNGGSSYWGGGGRGGRCVSSGHENGNAGTAYGSGGGGGASTSASTGTGGAGKAGVVYIREYCSA